MRALTCPKCSGSMAEGFLLENVHGYNAAAEWVEGAPEKSIWTGLKIGGRTRHKVQTWRCGRCGFLESYAK